MRGVDIQNAEMGSYVVPEQRVPQDHPLRRIRPMMNEALERLSSKFDAIYSPFGRPSIAPEYLLRASLLQVLFSIRSERQLMEQLQYNLLFRWFVGLSMDDAVWDPTVYSKNRERFLTADIQDEFFAEVLGLAEAAGLLSGEHFTVDGTLIEAWASQKSFRPKDGPPDEKVSDLGEGGRNPSVDFHGEKRSNATHASITDPDARLARKSTGGAYVLAYGGHILMDNRHGLVANGEVTHATGTAECEAAINMVNQVPGKRRITLGADKKYDTEAFVAEMRERNVTPHVAQNLKAPGGSAIDGRTTSHEGYAVSIRRRKLVEQIFGWGKTVGMMRKAKMRGLDRVGWMFKFNAAAYNLVRMAKLLAGATPVPA
jgi:transposase